MGSLTNRDGKVRTLHKINPEILEHARRTCNADIAEIIEDAEYIIVEKTNTPTNAKGTTEDRYIKTETDQDFSIGQEIEGSYSDSITGNVKSLPREPDDNPTASPNANENENIDDENMEEDISDMYVDSRDTRVAEQDLYTKHNENSRKRNRNV